MAALKRTHPISFVQWMIFEVSLAFGLLAAIFTIVIWRTCPAGTSPPVDMTPVRATASTWTLAATFGRTVLLRLTEPLHGVRA